jgi:enoyl-CoA hydratase/carnithine racemase
MARLPRVMGRARALEVLLSSDDIRGADAERLGYVNRALPVAELDDFVDAPAAQEGIKALLDRGLQEPGGTENRLGLHVGQLSLDRER